MSGNFFISETRSIFISWFKMWWKESVRQNSSPSKHLDMVFVLNKVSIHAAIFFTSFFFFTVLLFHKLSTQMEATMMDKMCQLLDFIWPHEVARAKWQMRKLRRKRMVHFQQNWFLIANRRIQQWLTRTVNEYGSDDSYRYGCGSSSSSSRNEQSNRINKQRENIN